MRATRIVALSLLMALAHGLAAQTPAAPQPAKDPPKGEGSLFERTVFRFGGSFATSYGGMLIRRGESNATMREEGFAGEFALSFKVEPPVHGVSGAVRACYGCHGLEFETAVVQYRPFDALCLKAGRFNLPLGGLNDRHDPNVRKGVSQPLTRIMGNMVNGDFFNQGVLPAPAVDTGTTIGGMFDLFNSGFSFGYDAFLVAGLKGDGADINFDQSRDLYDNNGEPAIGARIGIDSSVWSFSASYMMGHNDEERRLRYQVVSLDTRVRLGRLTIEAEAAGRQTQYINARDHADSWLKFGYFVQADLDVWKELYLIVAVDSLHVSRVFLGENGPTQNVAGAVTDDYNSITRIIGGIQYVPWGGIRLKLCLEYWNFSDFDDVWVVQTSVGWAF